MLPFVPTDAKTRDLDSAVCRATIRDGSHSFYLASLLLPKRVFEPALAIYSFCRLADDAADKSSTPHAEVARFRKRLNLIYEGVPLDNSIDRMFCQTVHTFGIPQELPEALLEGLEWDCEGRTYATLNDLEAYAARVAGTVGAMMAILMRSYSANQLEKAAELGIAMQLTNIARDIGEDAARGRLYLPLDWMQQAGIDPMNWRAEPRFTPELQAVVLRLLEHAEKLYADARSGIANLPRAYRPAIETARRVYRDIGRYQISMGIDPCRQRAVVPHRRKLKLAAHAILSCETAKNNQSHLPCEAAHKLAHSVAYQLKTKENAALNREPAQSWWNLHAGIVSAIDLFVALELRDRNLQPIEDID